ncbi:hypothetical protein QTP70_012845 [Hemibagrus guttatus]|uniref:Uncharacterized protein n=1 Tax=Hemibagrus guttatus TaxID=175788 RepID=A0AAE0V9J3_9TELE|nr:hypothetical protein QTP70_012845 [Hemibagrus guttatus]
MARRPSNLKELELIAKYEWAKIPVETCKKLTSSLSQHQSLEVEDVEEEVEKKEKKEEEEEVENVLEGRI